MKIRIPIPKFMLAAWDNFGVWSNVPVFNLSRFAVVRLDIIQAVCFIFCVVWYYVTVGIMAAITGGLFYIFLVMCVMWIWRKD